MMRILAVGLLRPTPRRVAQDVDAHSTVEVGSHGPELNANGFADPFFEIDVPCGAAGHADREAGGLVDHHTPRAVGEGKSGQPQTVNPGRPERALVIALFTQVV